VNTRNRIRLLSGASAALGALPVGSGQHRAVRLLYERVIKPAPDEELWATCRLRGTSTELELNLKDFVQGQTFLARRYDPELVHFMRARLGRRPAVLVDVGAHIGLVAAQLAVFCPQAAIHAFEPHPGNAAALRRNLARNRGGSVAVNACAVSDTEAGVVLSVATEGSNWHYVRRDGEGVATPSVTLDGYTGRAGIDRVDMLKLDVEGHEPSVLRGALGLLEDGAIETIVTEIHEEFRWRDAVGDDDVQTILARYGYRMREIPGLGLHRLRKPPGNVYRNVYFEHVPSRVTGLHARSRAPSLSLLRAGASGGRHREEPG
jgi:FkbM family methyltransferase